MFAATSIDWSTVGSLAWHTLLVVLVIGVLLVMGIAIIAVLIHVADKVRGSGGAAKTPAAAPSTLAKIEASPVVHDAEMLAAKVAEKLLSKAQNAPPLTVSGHPAVTAVADVVQESAVYKDAIAQAKQALQNVEQKLAAPAKPAA